MPEATTRPFSIRLFLPDGDPDGLRIVEKSNWSGVGLVFPRSLFPEAAKRSELQSPGIYILVGENEDSSLPRIYIGQADPLYRRLSQHYAQKDFWSWGVCFTSRDQNLNRAHVIYLEDRLIAMAQEAKQATLENDTGSPSAQLSEPDQADAESFLQDMLSIFPLVGLSAFERPDRSNNSTQTALFLSLRGAKSEGFETTKGFVVKSGSRAAGSETSSIHQYISAIRKDLIDKGVLRTEGEGFIFTEDYAFRSPTMAAGVLLGRAANGRNVWKDANGRTLKALQQAATVTEPSGDD